MSYDLAVYGAASITPEQLERAVGGVPVPAFTVDGPLRVEREDLPDEVAARAVGIVVSYQLSVAGAGGRDVQLARGAARALADVTGGVVYDPQDDAVVWPRGAPRRFRPPAARRVDLLECEWFVRREDLAADLPRRLLAAIRTWAPEALPRRFGDVEPLQHRFDEDGDEGFCRLWQTAATGLFWKGVPPCFGGRADDLGEVALASSEAGHPVGSLALQFDLRVMGDERWRRDLIDGFCRVADVTGAFYAQAGVERGWVYGGGSLRCDADTGVRWGQRVRGRWYGLPPYPLWLAWFGPRYRVMVEPYLDGELRTVAGGVLRRDGAHPAQAHSTPWPAELTMRIVQRGHPMETPDRYRAATVPPGV